MPVCTLRKGEFVVVPAGLDAAEKLQVGSSGSREALYP